jgi:hypothetical protein
VNSYETLILRQEAAVDLLASGKAVTDTVNAILTSPS